MPLYKSKLKKLNLGCEKEYRKEWVNLDFDERVKADVYWDLNKFPYPFKDDSFEEILASSVLEHLDNIYSVMMELHRIGKDKGLIYVYSPHTSCPFLSWTEFEHKNAFSYMSFGEWFVNKELYPYFEVLKKKIVFTRINFKFLNKILNPIINMFPVVYERLFSGILQSSGMVYILRIRKDKQFQESKMRRMNVLESRTIDDNLKFIKEI